MQRVYWSSWFCHSHFHRRPPEARYLSTQHTTAGCLEHHVGRRTFYSFIGVFFEFFDFCFRRLFRLDKQTSSSAYSNVVFFLFQNQDSLALFCRFCVRVSWVSDPTILKPSPSLVCIVGRCRTRVLGSAMSSQILCPSWLYNQHSTFDPSKSNRNESGLGRISHAKRT